MKKHTLAPLVLFTAALVSLNACGGGKSSSARSSASASSAAGAPATAGAMPDCGAVKPVWVNLNTKVYHEPGDPHYGTTKHGEYLCPSQATAQGYHAAGGERRRHGRHRKGSDSQGG